jgi:hypothetical protein
MVKKTFLVLICFIGLIIFVSTLHGQGSKKTITLPSGEVIWDLKGEWDAVGEGYGDWSGVSVRGVIRIFQQGSSFVAIRTHDFPGAGPMGSEAIRGELDKSGLKKVRFILQQGGFLDAKGQISEDGNKLIFDDGEKLRVTYTRK